MTPICERLALKLDNELTRMKNEWFFKWHHIGGQRTIVIESFRGRPITYCGIEFSGSAHQVYWDTIQLYLRKKASELFHDLETELKEYPVKTRAETIDEAENLILKFSNRIKATAIEKDRILRGDGINFPESHDFGKWNGSKETDIRRLAYSLRSIYCVLPNSSPRHKANKFYDDHRMLLFIVGIVIAISSILLAF